MILQYNQICSRTSRSTVEMNVFLTLEERLSFIAMQFFVCLQYIIYDTNTSELILTSGNGGICNIAQHQILPLFYKSQVRRLLMRDLTTLKEVLNIYFCCCCPLCRCCYLVLQHGEEPTHISGVTGLQNATIYFIHRNVHKGLLFSELIVAVVKSVVQHVHSSWRLRWPPKYQNLGKLSLTSALLV